MENLRKYRRDALLLAITAAIGLFSFQALRALPYYPQQWPWLVLGIIAVLALISPRVGVAAALLFHLPAVAQVSLELGIGYLVLSVILITSTGDRVVSAFLLLGVIAAGFWFEPLIYLLFVVPPLAGLVFGMTGGMILAASAAFFIESLGMIAGRAMIGPVFTGGTEPLFRNLPAVASILDLSWLRVGLSSFDLWSVTATLLRPYVLDPQLLAIVALWAFASYFTARLTRQEVRWSRQNAFAIAIGIGILVLGHIVIPWVLGGYRVPPAAVLITGLASGVVAVLAYPLLENANQLSAGFELR